MQELNFSEISLVSGGDASATRQPGQNSWGEYPEDRSEPNAWTCLMDLLQGIFSNRFRPDCP